MTAGQGLTETGGAHFRAVQLKGGANPPVALSRASLDMRAAPAVFAEKLEFPP